VWRPSTSSVVGFIYDSDTTLGVEWGTTEDGQVLSPTGSAVTVLAGDVLVISFWRHAAQGMAVAYTQTLYFDGATDVTDATTTDAASYLETPQVLTFSGLALVKIINETEQVTENVTRRMTMVRIAPAEITQIPENVTRLKSMVRITNETVNVPETVSKVKGIVKVFNETVQALENIVKIKGIVRIIGETVQAIENVLRRMAMTRVRSETVNVAEVVITAKKTVYGSPFLYTVANWAAGSQFFFEVFMRAITGTIKCDLIDVATGDAVANSALSTTDTTLTRLRTVALIFVNGATYRARFSTNGSGAFIGAKLIVTD